MYYVREKSTSISRYLICYVDRRKLGREENKAVCDEESSFGGVPDVRDVVARALPAPDLILGTVTLRNLHYLLLHIIILEHQSHFFGLHRVG